MSARVDVEPIVEADSEAEAEEKVRKMMPFLNAEMFRTAPLWRMVINDWEQGPVRRA
jgi:hypothetical protein